MVTRSAKKKQCRCRIVLADFLLIDVQNALNELQNAALSNMIDFLIYCKTDGKCFLKNTDGTTSQECTDLREAVSYALKAAKNARLTVFDALGKVVFTYPSA